MKKLIAINLCFLISFYCFGYSEIKSASNEEQPRIVNIINFICLLEPRYDGRVTEKILCQTVGNQIEVIQMTLNAKLRDEKKVNVETLAESGQWFKKNFNLTPPTSVSVLNKFKDDNRQTVWLNSRYYRANLIWEKNTLRIRDIHLFNEKHKSAYLLEQNELTTGNYYNLPFIDGNIWSDSSQHAGLRLKAIINNKEVLIEGGVPAISDSENERPNILWPLINVD